MDELMFAVFAVSTVGEQTPWPTYVDAMAAAQAMKDRLNGVYGDYTFVVEWYGGNTTPTETKCATAFMDPVDRQYLAEGDLLAGTTLITELEQADNNWAPPPDVIGLRSGESIFVEAKILKKGKKCGSGQGHGHGHGHHRK